MANKEDGKQMLLNLTDTIKTVIGGTAKIDRASEVERYWVLAQSLQQLSNALKNGLVVLPYWVDFYETGLRSFAQHCVGCIERRENDPNGRTSWETKYTLSSFTAFLGIEDRFNRYDPWLVMGWEEILSYLRPDYLGPDFLRLYRETYKLVKRVSTASKGTSLEADWAPRPKLLRQHYKDVAPKSKK